MIKYEISEVLKVHKNIIRGTFRYSNEISFKCEETKPWESKLGGCPYLENIEGYLVDEDGKLMLLLVQINLADLQKLGDLPQNGLLQLDIDDECDIMFGDSENCVLSIPKDALKNKDFSKVVYDWQCCYCGR